MRRGLRLAALAAAAAACLSQAAAAAPAPAVAGRPKRILSMNMCTDLLVLQLAPRSRIAAVTYLAKDAAGAVLPGGADGVAVNYGTAEDILKFRPDLILGGDWSTALTRRMAAKVGAPLVEVPAVNDFAGVRRIVRQVGAAVGEPARAEALVRDMDRKLAALAAAPPRRRPQVVAWSGGDSVPGRATLADAIIRAAGADNIAARPGLAYTTFGVEQVLAAQPDALLSGKARGAKPSLRGEEGRHRAVRRAFAGRMIPFAEVGGTCGLPQSADAAVSLRRALDALPARAERLR